MALQREHWQLQWTTAPRAMASTITIFDFSELRATVDTNRVAAGLAPIKWVGRSDNDPTFVAGRTLVRAAHFTQLRQALAELYRANGLDSLPQFRGGPIEPTTRAIRLDDLLEPRCWIERYEAQCPDLASRVVRRYEDYSVPDLHGERAEGKLTEMWDGAGFARYFYDRAGRLSRELRVLDNHQYWTAYHHDRSGEVAAITYPDGERLAAERGLLGSGFRVGFGRQSQRALVRSAPTGEVIVAEARRHLAQPDAEARCDCRGRPLLLGDPARPLLRLAYDGNGLVVKRLDEAGTCHLPTEHYERLIACDGWSDRTVKYMPSGGGGRWLILGPSGSGRRRAEAV